MGIKPIFEEERQFIQRKTGVELPTDCWRDASKIYLDFTQEKPIYKLKVKDMELTIKKVDGDFPPQKKLQELIETYKDQIEESFEWSCVALERTILRYPDRLYIVGNSGGKDSDLVYAIWTEVLGRLETSHPNIYSKLDWVINFANTSNDTADTYQKVKQLPSDKLKILNPETGFYKWITDIKNYKIPNVLTRNCCSTYKEGQIYSHYDTDRQTIQVLGVRKDESTKRAKYRYEMDGEFYQSILGKNSLPAKWIVIAPIVDWKDEEVWLWLLSHDIQFNRQYRLGFSRCGCLICPYQTAYTDLLIKEYYPKMWDRWMGILKVSYEKMHVKKNFKWSLDEWLNGQWKEGKSKEQSIIHLNPTPARVKELAELKGISENMARKYFQRTCASCGKKLNSTEIAMFYKLNGRFENVIDDTRPIQCKKCYCKATGMKQKEYMEKALRFVDQGCNLF